MSPEMKKIWGVFTKVSRCGRREPRGLGQDHKDCGSELLLPLGEVSRPCRERVALRGTGHSSLNSRGSNPLTSLLPPSDPGQAQPEAGLWGAGWGGIALVHTAQPLGGAEQGGGGDGAAGLHHTLCHPGGFLSLGPSSGCVLTPWVAPIICSPTNAHECLPSWALSVVNCTYPVRPLPCFPEGPTPLLGLLKLFFDLPPHSLTASVFISFSHASSCSSEEPY